MEYLQYVEEVKEDVKETSTVLNLIINGIPSIQVVQTNFQLMKTLGFKPYYKWNTFNTYELF